jgi:hypothetical protein
MAGPGTGVAKSSMFSRPALRATLRRDVRRVLMVDAGAASEVRRRRTPGRTSALRLRSHDADEHRVRRTHRARRVLVTMPVLTLLRWIRVPCATAVRANCATFERASAVVGRRRVDPTSLPLAEHGSDGYLSSRTLSVCNVVCTECCQRWSSCARRRYATTRASRLLCTAHASCERSTTIVRKRAISKPHHFVPISDPLACFLMILTTEKALRG